MTSPAHAHILLTQWAAWSRTEGVIPKELSCVSALWQKYVVTEYPEEPEHEEVTWDDVTMGVVDSVVAGMGRTNVRYYVVILDVYRNGREYDRAIEDAAIQHFANLYGIACKRPAYA